MRKTLTISILCGMMLTLVLGTSVSMAQDTTRPEGWDEYSHGNDTEPDYAVVFPQDAVNTITITVSPENWAAMQADLTTLFGEFGSRQNQGGRPNGGGGDGQPPANFDPNQAPPMGGDGQPPPNFDPNQAPPNGGGFAGGMDFSAENPIWVNADVSYNGQTWTNVGFRYKGNSTLTGAWGSGSLKLGFKLNFDRYEDDYPEIDNQRFYGFDELSFSSNYRDTSYLHEKVAADLFREAGVAAANTSFYAVSIDYGDGPVYIGLYTAVEAIEDTVIQTQFSDDSGNLYKPEGTGASFQAGTFDEATFSKETNEDEADYSDILALFDALHSDTRTSDAATWRANLEAVLDVDGFLHWLAVNTVIQNWDVYGTMAHNYYLYNDPSTGLLTWIPWDNNEAFSGRGGGGRRGGGSTGDLTQASVNEAWPLIRYLMDDPTYKVIYDGYVAAAAEVFEPSKMEATYRTLHDMIAPYVVGDGGTQAADMELDSAATFEDSLNTLIEQVQQRQTAVQAYLGS
ncbi:MAG: CotH kinase family protein [Chloroflexi bacterium]|nr:CotH kinase family protein [Chloroflexota bacterium]